MRRFAAAAAARCSRAAAPTMARRQASTTRRPSTLPPLEVPPDLTAPRATTATSCPKPARRRHALGLPGSERKRAGASQARSRRAAAGRERAHRARRHASAGWWCEEPPEKLWPVVREFWQENGFLHQARAARGRRDGDRLGREPRQHPAGRRARPARQVRSTSSTRPPSATSSARGSSARADGNGTEIYISHRGMEEVYTSCAIRRATRRADTTWQPRPADPGARGRVPAPADGAPGRAARSGARSPPPRRRAAAAAPRS